VFGQNTYGWRGIKGYENLWDYSGVLPIDAAMAEYPLVMRLSPEREAMLDAAEAYDLAVQATPRRGTTGLIRLAKVAVEKAPRSADALALLGELQVTYAEDEADRDEGIKTLTRALDLDPKNLRTLILLSSIKAALGEVVEAVRYADQAVDAEPDDWESWLHRAQINHEIGRDTQALDDLKHAEDLSLGVTPEPLLLSGEVNYALKKFEKGREAYRRALEIHPASADAKMGLARYYTLTGDHTSALLEYDKINREYPNNPLILGATARAYEAVEDHKKAVETYQSAIEQWTRHRLLPPEADYLEAAAIALEKLGWKGPAFRLYKQYLANYLGSERSFEAHVATAEILEEDGFKPGAKAHLIQALLLRKDDEGVRKSFKRLGDVLFSLDDIRKLLGPYQYPLTLAATLISVSPLDFAVTKREQVAELLKEFPPNIVVAMIKSTNFYAEAEEKKAAPEKPKRAARPAPTPRPKPAPKPAPEPNAAALVGDWAGPVRDVNFGQQIGSLEIVFYEDGRYEAQMTSYGVAPMYESGTYQISGDTVRMTTDYGQSVDYRFRLEGGTLRLWNPATGEIVLTPA
jgi:tetratricopeptide (TPR) repeat protein